MSNPYLATENMMTYCYEMSISHHDFFRTFHQAFNDCLYQKQGNTITRQENNQQLTITLSPETQRRIALICLPVTHITLTFKGYSPRFVHDFIRQFHQAYQRGGG
ncbi:hypothetical protein BegalDRAFT_0320 [Beggiatoa alba B18LD]|uniref:Uncharacterized protein n=1 Tax=Beggiatoa alba B18LD TaxID=395493 RepID=I3CC97_9GAMM|nr:hypothetical protein [Beggiatoa alba]EIJ41240.1 hypothetical protein BegalDRAFT_0320 [Beggiatoa alba B18LD]